MAGISWITWIFSKIRYYSQPAFFMASRDGFESRTLRRLNSGLRNNFQHDGDGFNPALGFSRNSNVYFLLWLRSSGENDRTGGRGVAAPLRQRVNYTFTHSKWRPPDLIPGWQRLDNMWLGWLGPTGLRDFFITTTYCKKYWESLRKTEISRFREFFNTKNHLKNTDCHWEIGRIDWLAKNKQKILIITEKNLERIDSLKSTF